MNILSVSNLSDKTSQINIPEYYGVETICYHKTKQVT